MDKSNSIYVAGHRGMVGSAVVRRLQRDGFNNILTRTRTELDLFDRDAVRAFFEKGRPALVVDAAAKVGGIIANNEQPVEFLLQNVTIQNNIIEAAADFGTEKLLFLGSSCIYPKFAPQPIPESALLTGALEPTNQAYAIAKITGIQLCQAYARQYGKAFLSAMPTNLYGPNDNFDLRSSHVLAALIRKVHEAKERGENSVVVWGSGNPRREFLHVDDLADACLFLLERYNSPEIINIGCGEDVTIRELAETVCEVLGFKGKLTFDTSKPDGTPRKLLDMSRLFSLGWRPTIPLRDGIRDAYQWFLSTKKSESRLQPASRVP
jgi:GDP-L-fucose synthase